MKITWGLIESFYLGLVYIKYMRFKKKRFFSMCVFSVQKLVQNPTKFIINKKKNSISTSIYIGL